jgi:hypothetical protein
MKRDGPSRAGAKFYRRANPDETGEPPPPPPPFISYSDAWRDGGVGGRRGPWSAVWGSAGALTDEQEPEARVETNT